MSTGNLVIALLGLWALLGFIVVLELPRPKTKGQAALQWIISGPFGWLIGCFMLGVALADRAQRK